MNKSLSYLIVAVFALAVIAVFHFSNSGLTGFSVFEQGDVDGFNMTDSSWVNVTWSGSAIVLVENITIGEYVSGVFGNGTESNWNNLTYEGDGGLSFEGTVCSDEICSDADFSEITLDELNLTGGYFQYRVLFDSLETAPELSSVSINYVEVVEDVFTLTVNSPLNQTYDDSETQAINFSTNSDILDVIIYNWNGTNFTYTDSVDVLFEDGLNTLGVWANDTSGEMDFVSVSFTIAIPSCGEDNFGLCEDETSCDGAGGYWYNSGCNDSPEETESDAPATTVTDETITVVDTEEAITPAPAISYVNASDLGDFRMVPGSSMDLSWEIASLTGSFLFACSPSVSGNGSEMVSFGDAVKNINPEETLTFPLSLNVSEDVEDGTYSLKASLGCTGLGDIATETFSLTVEKDKLEFNVVSVQRVNVEQIKILYSLTELLGIEQNVSLNFTLLNSNEEAVANASDEQILSANATETFELITQVNSSEVLDENVSLLVDFDSAVYSNSVTAPVSIGAPVGGFAIFGGIGTGTIIIFAVTLLVIVVAFIIVRRIRTLGNKK